MPGGSAGKLPSEGDVRSETGALMKFDMEQNWEKLGKDRAIIDKQSDKLASGGLGLQITGSLRAG